MTSMCIYVCTYMYIYVLHTFSRYTNSKSLIYLWQSYIHTDPHTYIHTHAHTRDMPTYTLFFRFGVVLISVTRTEPLLLFFSLSLSLCFSPLFYIFPSLSLSRIYIKSLHRKQRFTEEHPRHVPRRSSAAPHLGHLHLDAVLSGSS